MGCLATAPDKWACNIHGPLMKPADQTRYLAKLRANTFVDPRFRDRRRELAEILFNTPGCNVNHLVSADAIIIRANGVNSSIQTLNSSFQPGFQLPRTDIHRLGVPYQLHNLQIAFKAYHESSFCRAGASLRRGTQYIRRRMHPQSLTELRSALSRDG